MDLQLTGVPSFYEEGFVEFCLGPGRNLGPVGNRGNVPDPRRTPTPCLEADISKARSSVKKRRRWHPPSLFSSWFNGCILFLNSIILRRVPKIAHVRFGMPAAV